MDVLNLNTMKNYYEWSGLSAYISLDWIVYCNMYDVSCSPAVGILILPLVIIIQKIEIISPKKKWAKFVLVRINSKLLNNK